MSVVCLHGLGRTTSDWDAVRAGLERCALASLARLAAQPGRLATDLDAVQVIHARDDHHVPIDFALAAAGRQGWAVAVLDRGGHHPHVDTPERWLAAAVPWLEGQRIP